jgi:hypothetical protein
MRVYRVMGQYVSFSEQGLKLYRGGISENHCLIHLELGKSKHLLPIAVDHVGNHENNINTSSENTIHAKSNIKFGNILFIIILTFHI